VTKIGDRIGYMAGRKGKSWIEYRNFCTTGQEFFGLYYGITGTV
jgi:hypothetical protein